MSQRAATRPIDLPAPATWDALMPGTDEFRRVKLRAQFVEGAKSAFVYTGGSALRDDIKTPGYFVFAPARAAGRTHRRDQSRLQRAAGRKTGERRGRDRRLFALPGNRQPVRVGSRRGRRPPGSCAIQRAMAKTLGWGEVAPFYIDQESPVPAGGVPKPGPLKVQLTQRPSRLCADLVRPGGRAGRCFRGLGLVAAAEKGLKNQAFELPCESPPDPLLFGSPVFPSIEAGNS